MKTSVMILSLTSLVGLLIPFCGANERGHDSTKSRSVFYYPPGGPSYTFAPTSYYPPGGPSYTFAPTSYYPCSDCPGGPSTKAPSTKSPSTKSPSTKGPSARPSARPTASPSEYPITHMPTSESCPPYYDDRYKECCGSYSDDPNRNEVISHRNEVLSTSTGPEVGGTVIEITQIQQCLKKGSNVYCRFQGDFSDVVVQGTRINYCTFQCISPPSNGSSSAIISYAIFRENCFYDVNEVVWNVIKNDEFFYAGDTAGVVVTPTFDYGGTSNENSRLLFAEREYIVNWNSKALLLSAVSNDADESSLVIDLEVLVYIQSPTKSDKESTFLEVVQSTQVSSNIGIVRYKVDSEAIKKALYSYEGIGKLGLILLRVVASTTNYKGLKVTYATRVSKLTGILPVPSDDTFASTCPVSFDTCDPQYEPPPCPPTFDLAENDFDFYPDETCYDQTVGDACVATSDLDIDLIETCEDMEDHPEYDTYCGNVDKDADIADNCNCNYFQNGAQGCVKNGESQCCYSPDGGLLKDPRNGAGTRDCRGNNAVDHLIFNVLPYIFCCKLNDDCDTYYNARPTITSDGYVHPEITFYTFGDPHFLSFDKINFDFNGYGEYVAFCGKDSNTDFNLENCKPNSDKSLDRQGTVSVHYRIARLEESHNGTALVGVAIEDKSFRRGKTPLTVVTSTSERLSVYDGHEKILFPKPIKGKKNMKNKKLQKRVDGVKIFKPRDVNREDFDLRVTFLSGLIMRLRESKGVITATFVQRPKKNTENYVGLFSHPDGDNTNDFMNADGTILDTGMFDSVPEKYKAIFNNVGQSWMIRRLEHSLFRKLGGSNHFDFYYEPNYIPSFDHFPDPTSSSAHSRELSTANENCTVSICQSFTGYLRESCCFDYAVTNNTELVEAIMKDAEKEDTIQKILNNTLPTIEGGVNQTISVGLGESASFTIQAFDENGEKLTASLERNDGNLFELSTSPNPGRFNLKFSGTTLFYPNTWKAQVIVSDGIGPVLFTASVYIPPLPCVDDKKFRQKGIDVRTCKWVGENESRRQTQCYKDWEVRTACPITCGTCCADNEKFKLKLPSGTKKTCDWIGKTDFRKQKYCDPELGKNVVRANCRLTCSTCYAKYLCLDKKYYQGDKGLTCKQIGRKESRRVKYCSESRGEVRGNNCPVTCGRCCDDNPDFLTRVISKGVEKKKGCEWIAKKPSRINQYCSEKNVNTNCPSKTTCNTCKVRV